MTCSFPNCDRPLHGGVRITKPLGGGVIRLCSASYVADHYSGLKYMITAGHCQPSGGGTVPWSAIHSTTNTPYTIGPIDVSVYGANGDYARVKVEPGSFWDQSPFPARVAFWGINNDYPTNAQGWSYAGIYGCRTGGTTSAQCGTVTQSGLTKTNTDGVLVNGLFEVNVCASGGDSGGPFMANYYAIGILSSSTASCPTPNTLTYYSEVMNAIVPVNLNLTLVNG
jgi:streptogrisin C